MRRALFAVAASLVLIGVAVALVPGGVTLLDVTLPRDIQNDAAGRLLVFAQPVTAARDNLSDSVDASVLHPTAVAVAGQDIRTFGVERRVTVDLDRDATPEAFSELPAGDYQIQVVLDPDGDYGRYGRDSGDVVSKVTTLHLPLTERASIALDHTLPNTDPWNPPGASPAERAGLAVAKAQLTDFVFSSPMLSAYWGRSVDLQAWVLLPTGYSARGPRTWPVVYFCGPGSSSYIQNLEVASLVAQMNRDPGVPQMIWVFLNYSTLTGTTEFADSVNNGPWEGALLRELIPALERRFRMDARPSGRFLTGHSSGGWASIWLEIRHPDVFGGAWATAPDPNDFHDFVGVNMYAPDANMYFDSAGHLRPLVRSHGEVTATLRDFVRLEEVLGHAGGTFQSFDWVFSPRAADGRPAPMFNRLTGAVDPAVATYWAAHYDTAAQIEQMDGRSRRKLAGNLHVMVGDLDSFYLDGAVHKLQESLRRTGVPADIHFVPGKNHNDLYGTRGDPLALLRDFTRAMYGLARPQRLNSR